MLLEKLDKKKLLLPPAAAYKIAPLVAVLLEKEDLEILSLLELCFENIAPNDARLSKNSDVLIETYFVLEVDITPPYSAELL